MSRYINAEKLIDEIMFNEEDAGIIGSKEVIDIIQNMPSDDLGEVVRCKYCNKSVCIGERYFCDIQYDEWGQPYVVKPDGFCDCGERKDEK